MKNAITYEWDYETVVDGEIEDHNHADSLSQYPEAAKTDTLVLIRQEGNENEGVVNRAWAYVKDGKLPEHFADELGKSIDILKVPQRFHDELKQHIK